MNAIWVADTEPNERFTLYTRGNVGEVFPHVITALTGTLIGEAIRKAQSDVLVEMGVLRRGEVAGPSATTGVFGGYLYMNGSAMRLFGVPRTLLRAHFESARRLRGRLENQPGSFRR